MKDKNLWYVVCYCDLDGKARPYKIYDTHKGAMRYCKIENKKSGRNMFFVVSCNKVAKSSPDKLDSNCEIEAFGSTPISPTKFKMLKIKL